MSTYQYEIDISYYISYYCTNITARVKFGREINLYQERYI